MDGNGPIKILKRDVLGRVTVTREQREALLDEFERGGLKGKPFARLVGISYPTFASWMQQRRHARGDYARLAALSPKPPAAKLLPAPRAVRLMGQQGSVPNGTRLRPVIVVFGWRDG